MFMDLSWDLYSGLEHIYSKTIAPLCRVKNINHMFYKNCWRKITDNVRDGLKSHRIMREYEAVPY